jgi:hypothetical protein
MVERGQFELSGDFVIAVSKARALKVFHRRATSLRHQVLPPEGLDVCPESSNACVTRIGAGDYEAALKDKNRADQPRQTAGATRAAQARGTAQAIANDIRFEAAGENSFIVDDSGDRAIVAGKSLRRAQATASVLMNQWKRPEEEDCLAEGNGFKPSVPTN